MGRSVNAYVCYGVNVQDKDLPWTEEYGSYDVEYWWYSNVHHYKPPFELYDEKGNHLPHVTNEMIKEYYAHRGEFRKKNPCPFDMVNYGSNDYLSYILASKSTIVTASWGDLRSIDPLSFVVSYEEISRLLTFCRQWSITYKDAPQWYLCAYSD